MDSMLFRRALIVFAMLAGAPAQADPVAEFYKGKSVQVVVGYGSGGGYDLYARVLARHMGRHIPGSPSMVIQNMPGAGSVRAANYLYAIAPKDGTVFGIFARNIPLLGILGGNSAVQYDPRKYTWLGSASSYIEDAYLMFARPTSAVKSLDDARRPGGPQLVLGGTGDGSTGNDIAILLRDVLGLNIKLISGYPDANALFIAIERGELDGRITDMSSVRSVRPQWYNKPVAGGGQPGGMNIFLQFARVDRHPDFPNVPTARELAPNERSRALIEIAEMPYLMSRPFVAPPGVPAARAKALQDAFMAAHRDPELLEEAKKLQIGVSPVSAQEVLDQIEKIAKQPADLLDTIRKLQEGNKG
jgi:tripartite-type tricarboxylate transporter receptor subunit TctC